MNESRSEVQKTANIEAVLEAIIEIEKLKHISRRIKPVGLVGYENSAEHRCHVYLSALMFREFADVATDSDRRCC